MISLWSTQKGETNVVADHLSHACCVVRVGCVLMALPRCLLLHKSIGGLSLPLHVQVCEGHMGMGVLGWRLRLV